METGITFRPLEPSDMELLHRWLNTGFVKRWYGKKDISPEEVWEKYSKYITKKRPTDAYIIQIDNHDAGYIQTYLVSDYPDYNKYIGAGNQSAALDLYIGEEDYIHKGYGEHIVKKFLKTVVFANAEIEDCILGPEPDNIAAIKTYSRAGFKYVKTVQLPNEDEPEYIMRIARKDLGLKSSE